MTCAKCSGQIPDGAKFCPWCGKAMSPTRAARKRGNGQGTAYKRGKTWEGARPGYSYTDDTGYHRVRPRKGGFATKKDALEWACVKKEVPEHSPKVIDLWTLYSENDLLKLSDSKQAAYKIARRRLEPVMGEEIHLVTLDALQAIISGAGSYYKARDIKTVLSQLYKKAMASNTSLVKSNLAEHLVLPKLEEKEAEPFTPEEVKSFWTLYDAGDPFVGYILLMIYSGMMPAEVLKCKKSMVDLEKCEIYGCGAKTKSRKKSAIVFPEILRPVVETLFNSEWKKHPFYNAYYDCIERAGVRKLPPYSCRHTYGTEAVKLGVHPAVVQKMLRHSTTKTQERYTHLSSEEAHEAANLFSRGSQVAHAETGKP